MSQTIDVNTEPLRWPVAPDGYIPNSVIRSWRWKGKGFSQTDFQEFPTNYLDSVSMRIFWFIQEEEEEDEEEKIDFVKRRRKEKEDKKNKKEEDKTDLKAKESRKKEKEVEKNEKENEKKTGVERRKKEREEKEEDKLDRNDLLKQSHNIQTKTILQSQLKTFDDGKLRHQWQEFGSTYSSRETVNFLLARTSSGKSCGVCGYFHPKARALNSTNRTDTGGLKLSGDPFYSNYHKPAATLATTEHPVKSSNDRQLPASISSVQPGHVAPLRVVQKIQMKNTLKLASSHFHHVIPMASQHSFFTLNPCGKTHYGRLQFDWVRGDENGKLLRASAHIIVDDNMVL
ncbi:uncharacterized protein AKAME5_000575100 [Lates japonicus]|uniref:Uncharacterized protein n=1 Tax=Lates japonicus TaxID=270547 RepID=A0AAD3R2D8_LATJO|nr:uncharacterized protein AKAME5_000575100 [Lates japonicus]